MRAACDLPSDILNSLRLAHQREESTQGKTALAQCIENAQIAATDRIPICQDTGIANFFVAMGSSCTIEGGTLGDAINEGCRRGYRDGYLRSSLVADPVYDRKNTGDNTPAFIHLDLVEGEALSITVLPKGGGCENMSALRMLKPAEGEAGIIDFVVETVFRAGGNPCPPVVVGVGIGGSAEKSVLLAKKALLRDIGVHHPDGRYRNLEQELLLRINQCGNGPQGLGGIVTAFAVHIETYPCHIASLPVAVNLNCHAARKATVVL
jgi:fumarate hydratase subunit alpha